MTEQTNEPIVTETPPTRRRWGLWLGVFALAAGVLAGAAYVAGQYLARPAESQGPVVGNLPLSGGGNFQAGASVGGGPNAENFRLNIQPAPELPTLPAETNGVFVKRVDNSVFIGTGNINVSAMGSVESNTGAAPEIETEYDGPELEVVFTQETKIYRDATELTPGADGTLPDEIQQKVTEGTLEEMGKNSTLSVWGRRAGDRIIAEVVLFSQPVMVFAPSP